MSSIEPEIGTDAAAVETFLRGLQSEICKALEEADGGARFTRDEWTRAEGGGGVSRILEDGALFERAGVGFSLVHGPSLPQSATAARPDLAGRSFRAMGVSLVLHPRNPYVPTTHMNVRFLVAERAEDPPIWWFGGGYDLTPFYPFEEDVQHWHRIAKNTCKRFGSDVYPRLKRWCDKYFYLKHRQECRGVGGLFCDDWTEGGFAEAFSLIRAIAESFLPAYLPILKKRRDTPYGERERHWQLVRRGRYVEFNLVWDRGTLFGLQSGGRTESILMSMPPEVRWRYDFHPEAGSLEAQMLEMLKPRDWV